MIKRCLSAAIAAVVFTQTPTSAFAANVEFDSIVATSCSIVVTRNGTLGTYDNARTLESKTEASYGLATVTATGQNFRINQYAPTGFLTRPAADTHPDFGYLAKIRSSGATNFNWSTQTNGQPLNAGVSDIKISFRAQKFIGKSFANGEYTAVVILSCE
ncbi:MAG: hypothetical protein U5K75_11345 [Ahrensia sp.]|nr:hypothetical protein [Ahrensia sp.]